MMKVSTYLYGTLLKSQGDFDSEGNLLSGSYTFNVIANVKESINDGTFSVDISPSLTLPNTLTYSKLLSYRQYTDTYTKASGPNSVANYRLASGLILTPGNMGTNLNLIINSFLEAGAINKQDYNLIEFVNTNVGESWCVGSILAWKKNRNGDNTIYTILVNQWSEEEPLLR